LAYESKHKAKLTRRELKSVNTINPMVPIFLRWSELEIKFNRCDHPNYIPSIGRYPLIVDPVIRNIQVMRCLVDRVLDSTYYF
jgi:hypothetical protein